MDVFSVSIRNEPIQRLEDHFLDLFVVLFISHAPTSKLSLLSREDPVLNTPQNPLALFEARRGFRHVDRSKATQHFK
jgi:hypothetical protein